MRQESGQAALAIQYDDIAHEPSGSSEADSANNVLFLQGPVGPFFARVAVDFAARGFNVHKINFNGGDRFFFRHSNAVEYTDKPEHWSDYLQEFIERQAISRIYVFGDCRYYHKVAKELAESLGISVFVFEEGYIRPNYITLERGGVNGFSPLINRPALVGVSAAAVTEDQEASAGKFGFLISTLCSIMYYIAASVHRRRYKYYIHHRPLNCVSEGAIWIRSAYRKIINRTAGKRVVKVLQTHFDNKYYLCPLQVHCDMQVVVHSPYKSIDEFICEVMSSFAKHATPDSALVFKHHPFDRGYTNYRVLIDALSHALHINHRVFYVHDVCLPYMLRNAEGSVMINSTVGLSSLYHETPVKVLGDAIYDRKGLTYQGPLDTFWNEPGDVDVAAVARFRSLLVRSNQLNGNLYSRCIKGSASGIHWSGKLLAEHSPIIVTEDIDIPKLRPITARQTEAANSPTRFENTSDSLSRSA